MNKPPIPSVPGPGDKRDRFDSAVAISLETIMGRRGTRIVPLETDATNAQVIAKINEILEVLQ